MLSTAVVMKNVFGISVLAVAAVCGCRKRRRWDTAATVHVLVMRM